ncbi:MAG: DUF5916 domain-containing protein [Rhodothermales bacterium]
MKKTSCVPARLLNTSCIFLFLILAGIPFCQSAQGQSRDVITISRLSSSITLDGMSNEPAWNAIDPWVPTQYEPNNGAPATEDTEIRVAYDDDYFYLSLRAYDKDSTGIRANTFYRDQLAGSDHFEIMIDTYNDNETGLIFTTTPTGTRNDAAISNDASGGGIASGSWINRDFNTFWDSATQITGEGWFAEVRIPFSSMRFQNIDGIVTMGINVNRKVARKTERLVFPSTPTVANWAFLKPSLAQKIQFKGVKPHKPLYITPYALGGLGHQNALNAAGTEYQKDNNNTGELGIDLKYGITDNLTADLTINTDFAQVEADNQQVNLTRFSLFFPEKRQFFQERAGVFDFRTGGLSRLFHSRRIGLTDDGAQVPLIGGARLVGRAGAWDLGFMDLQSARSGDLPSENFGVLRLRRNVFNPYSYAGGMLTSRLGEDGSYNVAYGLDSVFRLFRDDYLSLQWAQTFEDDETTNSNLTNGRLTAQIERRTRDGWSYQSIFAWAGADYNPGIGFTQRNDFTMLDNSISHTWIPGESSKLIFHQLLVNGLAFIRNTDGTVESASIGPAWNFSQKGGAGGSIEAKVLYEDLTEPFVLLDDDDNLVNVAAGSYTFFNAEAAYNVSHTNLIQIRPAVGIGSFFDGWQSSINIRPVWYISKHLELGGSYSFNHIEFPDRNQSFDVHVARLRIRTALNTKLSTNAFLQYNSVSNSFSTNVRFRYNFREGNDLWIVYNENLNTDRNRFLPMLPTTNNRTFLLKYTYTFGL